MAFDVNDIDVDSIRQYIINDVREEEERLAEEKMLAEETRSVIQAVKHDSNLSFIEKVKLAGAQGQKILSHKWNEEDDGQELFYEDNYYSILSRTFSIMNHVIAKESTERYRPDVLAKMPMNPKLAALCDKGMLELMETDVLDHAVDVIEEKTK